MNKREFWIAVSIFYFVCSYSLFAMPPESSGYRWHLYFEDNFDGDSLDYSKWNENYPWGSGHTHNHDAYCIAEQVEVRDGELSITAEYSPNYNGTGYDYISGVITSSARFRTMYGHIEARLKLPEAEGTWPAFWTLQSGWPPEIDIMENLDGSDTWYNNYHWGTSSDPYSSMGTYSYTNLTNSYHTFAVRWGTNLDFYFDDGWLRGIYDSSALSWLDEKNYILINLAVGGWAGSADPADYPTSYKCDWVRVWKRVPDSGPGLVGHWRLDEVDLGTGSPALPCDATGNSDGVIIGSPSIQQTGPMGPYDYSYDFSGGLHGVDTKSQTVVPATGEFSLFVWFKTSNYHSTKGHLFSNDDGQSGRASIGVHNGQLKWWIDGSASLTGAVRVDDGQWHMAGMIRGGRFWTLWLDGESVASKMAGGTLAQNRSWYIGRANANENPFEGKIADVRVWNYALPRPPEMEASARYKLDETNLLWNGADYTLVEDSTGTHIGGSLVGYSSSDDSYVNTDVINQPGPLGGGDKAYNFSEPSGISGINTKCGNLLPANDNFTLLVWFKTDNYHSVKGYLFSNEDGQSGRAGIGVHNGQLKWWIDGSTSLTGAVRVDDGQWHVAGVIRNGRFWTLWLDGESVASKMAGGTLTQNRSWYIGRAHSYGNDYDGLVGDLRVYDFAVVPDGDINDDSQVTLEDYAILVDNWQDIDCGLCKGADLTLDEQVDAQDLAKFVEYWLDGV